MGVKVACINGHWSIRVNWHRRRRTRRVHPNKEIRAIDLAEKLRIGLELYGAKALKMLDIPDASLPSSDVPTVLVRKRLQFKEFELPQIPPCIYFLCLGDEVVYVGQTTTLTTRVLQHFADDSKLFDRVFYIPVPKKRLKAIEARFIGELRPKLNRIGKNGNPEGSRE